MHKIHSYRCVENEESSRAIYEMGNMELTELRQTSATIQCPSCLKHVPEGLGTCQCGVWLRPNQSTMDQVRTTFAALTSPHCRSSVIISREKQSGHNPWQQDHQKAMDAKRGVPKRGKHTSKLERWQNDDVYRASQLVHDWTGEWGKNLDNISKIYISHDAPHRQRLRHESTVYMRGVDSKKQAGPQCVNDLIVNPQQMLLPASNELKATEYGRFQYICGHDKITHWIPQSNNTWNG